MVDRSPGSSPSGSGQIASGQSGSGQTRGQSDQVGVAGVILAMRTESRAHVSGSLSIRKGVMFIALLG